MEEEDNNEDVFVKDEIQVKLPNIKPQMLKGQKVFGKDKDGAPSQEDLALTNKQLQEASTLVDNEDMQMYQDHLTQSKIIHSIQNKTIARLFGFNRKEQDPVDRSLSSIKRSLDREISD